MARFFEAPVIKAVDYAFQYPVEQIGNVLELEQKKQDAGLEKALSLMDVSNLDIIQDENDRIKRDALVQRNNAEIDALIYDDTGNVKDLRNIVPKLQDIARRRALEEQTGGVKHALTSALNQKTSYEEMVDKLGAAGTKSEAGISGEHADWLKEQSMQRYVAQGGIGNKNEKGFYQGYTPITPALYRNGEAVAEGIAEGWRTDKIQQGILNPTTSAFSPTAKDIDALKAKHPYYVNVATGDFQTGSLELATLDEIYESTYRGLTNDQPLLEYLKQEAQFAGGKNSEEEIAKYMEEKLNEFATNAATKYSTMHFESKTLENWRLKEQYRSHLRQKELEMLIPKEKPAMVLQSSGQKAVTKVTDPDGTIKNFSDLSTRKVEIQKRIAELQNKGSQLTPQERTYLQTYQDDLANLNSQLSASSNAINAGDRLLQNTGEHLSNQIAQSATDAIGFAVYATSGKVDRNEVRGAVINWINDRYSASELNELMRAGQGQIPGLWQFVQSIPAVKEAVSKGGTTHPQWKALQNGFVNSEAILNNYDYALKNALKNANIEEESQYTFFSTEEEGKVKEATIRLVDHLKTSTVDGYTVTATGQGFKNVMDYAANVLGVAADPNTVKAAWSEERSQRGNGIVKLFFKDTNGKPYEVTLEEKRETVKNNPANRMEMGVNMISTANALESEEAKNDAQARGSLLIGGEDYGTSFADSNVSRLHKAKDPRDQSTIVYKNGQPVLQVSYIPATGRYIMAEVTSDYIVDPALLLNPSSPHNKRLITNTRPWGGKGDAYYFNDINAMYEELGWKAYSDHKNPYSDLYKGSVNAPIQYIPGMDN